MIIKCLTISSSSFDLSEVHGCGGEHAGCLYVVQLEDTEDEEEYHYEADHDSIQSIGRNELVDTEGAVVIVTRQVEDGCGVSEDSAG